MFIYSNRAAYAGIRKSSHEVTFEPFSSSILFCASHIIGELATLGGILADDGVLSLKLDRVENLASVVSPLTRAAYFL